jgi:hypothetical protein
MNKLNLENINRKAPYFVRERENIEEFFDSNNDVMLYMAETGDGILGNHVLCSILRHFP